MDCPRTSDASSMAAWAVGAHSPSVERCQSPHPGPGGIEHLVGAQSELPGGVCVAGMPGPGHPTVPPRCDTPIAAGSV
eukprot:5735315-Amphidinium_carterae.3